ncbi:MAG: GAF domain-containing sensor histidine kinase [archaeon]
MDDGSRYGRVVTALHSVANDLMEIESRDRICRRTIEAAENLLDFDSSIIALEEDGMLHPRAVSSKMPLSEYEPLSIHEGLAGKTYRTGESFLIEDITECDISAKSPQWRSGISLPVGDYGNFQAVDEDPGAFDQQDLQLAELLLMHTVNHLNRVATREQLERQNQRLADFASIVSHDLRNPLTVAAGHLELAASECETEHVEEVSRSLTRMEDLIDDLLILARQGESISELEPVSLDSVVEDGWSNVAVGDARIRSESPGRIQADRDRLLQLFENLFRNAIEHAGETVTVSVGPLDTGFFVEDDGSGIDPGQQEHVFETGVTTKDEGTGMGLSIVRQIVNAHGWEVRLTDGRDGGARFEITGVEFAVE